MNPKLLYPTPPPTSILVPPTKALIQQEGKKAPPHTRWLVDENIIPSPEINKLNKSDENIVPSPEINN